MIKRLVGFFLVMIFALYFQGCGAVELYQTNIPKNSIVKLSVNTEEVFIINVDNKGSITRGENSFKLAPGIHSVEGMLSYTEYTPKGTNYIFSKHKKKVCFKAEKGLEYSVAGKITQKKPFVDWDMKIEGPGTPECPCL